MFLERLISNTDAKLWSDKFCTVLRIKAFNILVIYSEKNDKVVCTTFKFKIQGVPINMGIERRLGNRLWLINGKKGGGGFEAKTFEIRNPIIWNLFQIKSRHLLFSTWKFPFLISRGREVGERPPLPSCDCAF